ncbi:hypothetical protein ABTE12_18500, partial [Acinetobacter baumannii]
PARHPDRRDARFAPPGQQALPPACGLRAALCPSAPREWRYRLAVGREPARVDRKAIGQKSALSHSSPGP